MMRCLGRKSVKGVGNILKIAIVKTVAMKIVRIGNCFYKSIKK